MKKGKNIFVLSILFLVLWIVPFVAQAKGVVTIYFFRGETCHYCQAANTFFNSLKEDDEYKDLFVVRDWEIWNNTDNEALAQKVAKSRGETLNGVPYFIIGNKSWNGYATSYDDDIKAQIKATYNDDNFEDKTKEVVDGDGTASKDNGSLIAIIILVVVIGLIVGSIYFARKDVEAPKNNDKEKDNKKEDNTVIEEIKEEPKKTELKKITQKKKTTGTKKKATGTKKKKTIKKAA